MRDYKGLTRTLEGTAEHERPMTFAEVEEVIASPLPASARKHQAWWANTATHSHAASWMRAGWRTSRLNLASERLVFVRGQKPAERVGVEEKGSHWAGPKAARAESEREYPPGLVIGAERMLDALVEEKGLSLEQAVAMVLNEHSCEYWRKCWEAIDALGPEAPPMSSVDIIRGWRDA